MSHGITRYVPGGDPAARAEATRLRAEALTIPCPYPRCHAGTGEQCRNTTSGEPLNHLPAHTARLQGLARH